MGWDGMGWDGMGWDGMGWDGMGWDGMAWDGMGWHGMGWHGTGWRAMGWRGMTWQQVVALANLLPSDDETDELDSFMFQTVGHQVIAAYATCMGLPLFRRRIKGSS
ncbi:unnamed protein product, partial [Closterium sp. NIES-53]